MKIVDSHAHLYDEKFNKDRKEVIQRAKSAGIDSVIVPSEDTTSARKALSLSEEYPGFFYPACGFHPHVIKKFNAEELEKELKTGEYIAIGEIGLDYHYDRDVIDEQKDVLRKQFEFAMKFNLPVILHVREAFSDIFNLIDEFEGLSGVFHCFSGGVEEVREVLKRDFYVSFSGIITYKNAKCIREAAKIVPLHRILVETDSPYLSPIPVRGKRNEPSFIVYVIDKLSEILRINKEQLMKTTYENTTRLFKLNVGTT